MTTLDRLVQAQADNACTDIDNFHSWTTTALLMGGSSGWRGYVRFANITVPKDSVITAAWIETNNWGYQSYNPYCQYQDIDNAVRLTSYANFMAATWDGVGKRLSAGFGTPNPSISLSLVAQIQAIVNKAGWASGNAIAFKLSNAGDLYDIGSCDSFVQSQVTCPKLHIEYGDPTGITTLPPSGKTKTTCTLNGRLDSVTGTAACGFEWGETTAYEHGATATTNLTSPGLFSQPITGLTVNTEYHCRALATVGADTTYGDDMPFRIISTVQGISGLRHIYNPGTRIYNLEITFGGVSTSDEILPGEVTKAADNVVIPTPPVKPPPIPIPPPFYNEYNPPVVVNTDPNTSPLTITNNTKITGTNILTDIFTNPPGLGTGAGLSLGKNTTGLGTIKLNTDPNTSPLGLTGKPPVANTKLPVEKVVDIYKLLHP